MKGGGGCDSLPLAVWLTPYSETESGSWVQSRELRDVSSLFELGRGFGPGPFFWSIA